jgi:hypothetical protein
MYPIQWDQSPKLYLAILNLQPCNQEEIILSRKLSNWLVLRGILLLLIGSMAMACATSNAPVSVQQPQKAQAKLALETCAVVQDQELAEMRGCYDVYSFGMSIKGDIDLATNNFSFKTNYSQVSSASEIPSNLKVNNTGNQVAFNDGTVAYTAGIGKNSLGSGIMQVIQVAGSNVLVVANMDVTLNINNAVSRPVAGNMLTTPGTLSGILR